MHSKIAAYDQALQLRCGHGVHEYLKLAAVRPETDESFGKRTDRWRQNYSPEGVARLTAKMQGEHRTQRKAQTALTALGALSGSFVGAGAAAEKLGPRATVPGALLGALAVGAAARWVGKPHKVPNLTTLPAPERRHEYVDEDDPWNDPWHEYHHDNDLKEIGIADTHRPWAALNEPERRAYWDSATAPGNHLPTFHSKGGT